MAQLTAKQSRFVEEYPIDLNATQAAIRAGYSKKTAQQLGSEVLLKPVVAGAIQEALDARSKRTEFTADDVIRELRKIIDDPNEITKDRIRCLDLLGRNLAMFNKLIVAGDGKNPVAVTEISWVLPGATQD